MTRLDNLKELRAIIEMLIKYIKCTDQQINQRNELRQIADEAVCEFMTITNKRLVVHNTCMDEIETWFSEIDTDISEIKSRLTAIESRLTVIKN